MNAIIAAIKDRKNYILANDGRLLKKLIFLAIILILASQPGQIGEVVQQSMIDAYLQVSVFVGFTLLIFIGLDSLSSFDIANFLKKTRKSYFKNFFCCSFNCCWRYSRYFGNITQNICFLSGVLV